MGKNTMKRVKKIQYYMLLDNNIHFILPDAIKMTRERMIFKTQNFYEFLNMKMLIRINISIFLSSHV